MTRGFTIVEVFISIAIFTMMLLTLITMWFRFGTYSTMQNVSIEVNRNAGMTVNDLKQMVQQADAIVASHSYSGVTYTTGSTTLVLELPAINGSGDIVANQHDYVIYYATSTSLSRIVDGYASGARAAFNGQRTFTTQLSNASFSYNSGTPSLATAVTIDLLLSATAAKTTLQSHLIEKMYLRNL